MLDNKDPVLSPEQQEHFWKLLNPDMRSMFSAFEVKENWTQPYEELPEFYSEMADLIEEKSYTSPADVSNDTVDKLIVLLSSLSFRQSLACLSQLDKDVKIADSLGWVCLIYLRCLDITKSNKETLDKNLIAHANIIIDRIRVAVKTDLIIKIFSNPKMIMGIV